MPRGSRKKVHGGDQEKKEYVLSIREEVFVAFYVETLNATKAALMAGYAESVAKVKAWQWVSVTSCPLNKLHVRKAVTEQLEEKFEKETINSDWVLRRAKLIADFNIRKFIVVDDDGKAYYDFSSATDDDWYCIEEYSTEIRHIPSPKQKNTEGGDNRENSNDGLIPVHKIKIKAPSKVAALKLIGEHVKVQAFRQKIEQETVSLSYNMSKEEYLEARKSVLNGDDC